MSTDADNVSYFSVVFAIFRIKTLATVGPETCLV